MKPDIYALPERALLSGDPDEKGRLTDEAFAAVQNADGAEANAPPADFPRAGRPDKPVLVAPSQLTPRKMNTAEGYAAMLHAITHIEFNAVNLALDAAYRFRTLPFQFVRDWVRVAKEEVYHFRLMRERLRAFGFDYG
ncbi:ferritin-like domain-containing protein, partial [Neisseria gonorrhoeae]